METFHSSKKDQNLTYIYLWGCSNPKGFLVFIQKFDKRKDSRKQCLIQANIFIFVVWKLYRSSNMFITGRNVNSRLYLECNIKIFIILHHSVSSDHHHRFRWLEHNPKSSSKNRRYRIVEKSKYQPWLNVLANQRRSQRNLVVWPIEPTNQW